MSGLFIVAIVWWLKMITYLSVVVASTCLSQSNCGLSMEPSA